MLTYIYIYIYIYIQYGTPGSSLCQEVISATFLLAQVRVRVMTRVKIKA